MVSIGHKKGLNFWTHKKIFTVFGHFTQKALQNLGKTYFGHVPINRSHQMNNHFLPPEVTMYELNTEMFRKHDIFLFNVPNNKKLKKKVDPCN